MPFVPVPNVLLVEVRALKDGQHIENRFHVNCGHTPVLADISAVNSILSTRTLTDWLPVLPTDVSLVSNFYRSLEDVNAIQLEAPYDTGADGTATGTPGPNQNTICISLRSTGSGRGARGRLYWLGLSENQYTGNIIDSGALTGVLDAVTTLKDELAAGGYPWSIVSYRLDNAPRVGGPVLFEVISVLAVDNVLDSQRRRMPGHGT